MSAPSGLCPPPPAEDAGEQPGRVAAMIQGLRLRLHKNVRWEMADYEVAEGDREGAASIEEAEAVSSRVVGSEDTMRLFGLEGGRHHLLLDVDNERAEWVPSSTPGHHHLYVPLGIGVPWEDLVTFLDAAAAIGLIEPGYAQASKARGCTSLRLPWIKKGHEREAVAHGGILPPKRKPQEQPDPWAEEPF